MIPRGLAVTVTRQMEEQLAAYASELRSMNRRINLVSREDEDSIETRHVPHCLTLAIVPFAAGARVCDWGTGGGLPLIPLAILFPDVHFVGVDAVRKKTMAVETMARRIGVDNVEAVHVRAERALIRHHVSVSRATAPLADLWTWHRQSAVRAEVDVSGAWTGLVCLKGGTLQAEIDALKEIEPDADIIRYPIADLLDDPYFATKDIIHVTAASESDE